VARLDREREIGGEGFKGKNILEKEDGGLFPLFGEKRGGDYEGRLGLPALG